MKIELDQYNCCVSEDCRFRMSCAQHCTAGDFRSEEGFRPKLEWNGEWDCRTYGWKADVVKGELEGRMVPEAHGKRGFIYGKKLEELKQINYVI